MADNFLETYDGKTPDVMCQLSKGHADLVARNRKILTSIVEVIILCGRQNIPLRSHDDSKSNFVVLLQNEARHNEVLRHHLETADPRVKYTSPEIQNEIISICGEEIRRQIVEACNASPCYSFIADEATDSATLEQISLCVRFYNLQEKEVQEDFLGFVQARRTTGEALAERFLDSQREIGLDLEKMKGQGYDGASNMSGCHRGVQARIRQVIPGAVYVHCRAHSLNLAVVHACKDPLVRNMFDTVQQIAFAFSYSAKRLLAFNEELEANDATAQEMGRRVKLQNLCETRWASRANSLYTFKTAFPVVVDSLQVLENEGDTKARAYRCSILKFDFIISLIVVEHIMQSLIPLTKMLQLKSCDLVEAARESKVLIEQLRAERNDGTVFEALYAAAVELAQASGVAPTKPRTVGRQQNRENHPADTIPDYWRRALYLPFMDHLSTQLEDRLLSGQARFLAQYLIPSQLENLDDATIQRLYDEYHADFNILHDDFLCEIRRWKTRWSLEELQDRPTELTETLRSTNAELYPSVYKALVILATMPVSTATAERSFSIMRRLKNYLRSTMTTERLSGLALLHCYRTRQINVERVIDIFAGKKKRKLAILFH